MLAVVAGGASLDAARSADTEPTGTLPPRFSHVVVVVFENRPPDAVLGRGFAPTFNRLAARYALLRNYTGVAHPSLPNYLALVSGSTQGIRNDCRWCRVDARSIADTIPAAGLTWRAYVEGYTGPRAQPRHATAFFARIPFLRLAGVVDRPRRLRFIEPLSRFGGDLRAQRLPSLSLVVPSLCHDMHNCSVATGDRWLRGFVRPLLRSPSMRNSVLVLTFDEGPRSDRRGGGGSVPTVVVGPLVRRHARSDVPYDHYSLLRTIEASWGLPQLGESDDTAPITGIWRGRAPGPRAEGT